MGTEQSAALTPVPIVVVCPLAHAIHPTRVEEARVEARRPVHLHGRLCKPPLLLADVVTGWVARRHDSQRRKAAQNSKGNGERAHDRDERHHGGWGRVHNHGSGVAGREDAARNHRLRPAGRKSKMREMRNADWWTADSGQGSRARTAAAILGERLTPRNVFHNPFRRTASS